MLRSTIVAVMLAITCLPFAPRALADEPSYEMMKDQVLSAKMDKYIRASMHGCPMGTKAELVDCVRARMIQTWPQGKLAAAHCAGRSDPFEELDCITMTSLGIDLAILGGESDIASFVDRLGSDNGDATSHAATAFGKVVWDACPDGAGASKCRLDETLRKLELGDAELAR